jgi:hypothetical protein
LLPRLPLLLLLPDDLEEELFLTALFPDPLLEALRPPPELLDAPFEPPRLDEERPFEAAFLGADFLVAPFFDALFLEAAFLEAPFLEEPPRRDDFDALFLEAPFLVAPFFDAAFLEAPFFDALLEEPPRRDDLDALFLDAPFLVALFDEDLPPELFLAPFFDAAFFVDFAIFNGIYEGLINFLF